LIPPIIIVTKMPLSQEFLQYLADASIPEEEYHSLTPVERSSILKDFRLSTATSAIVGEEIEKAMMSTLEKYEAKKESKTITFSSVSEGQVSTYLASINLFILEGYPHDAEENSTISFMPFELQDIEEREQLIIYSENCKSLVLYLVEATIKCTMFIASIHFLMFGTIKQDH